jgi:Flp pilus assembly protein TadG
MATQNIRNQRGSLGTLLLALIIPILFGIGAFGLDMAHYSAVKGELQKAVDAAALAGAASLVEEPDQCENHALSVAEMNTADGRPVSNLSDSTTVTVEVMPCSDTEVGYVTVTANMAIRHMFAPIFGREWDIVTTSSRAGTYGTLTQIAADHAFPLAVSIDTVVSK